MKGAACLGIRGAAGVVGCNDSHIDAMAAVLAGAQQSAAEIHKGAPSCCALRGCHLYVVDEQRCRRRSVRCTRLAVYCCCARAVQQPAHFGLMRLQHCCQRVWQALPRVRLHPHNLVLHPRWPQPALLRVCLLVWAASSGQLATAADPSSVARSVVCHRLRLGARHPPRMPHVPIFRSPQPAQVGPRLPPAALTAVAAAELLQTGTPVLLLCCGSLAGCLRARNPHRSSCIILIARRSCRGRASSAQEHCTLQCTQSS